MTSPCVEQALGRGGLYPVARRVPAFGQAVEHLVGGVAVGERPVVARVGENFRLGLVHAAIGKFMVAADMVEMRVAGDAERCRSLTSGT